MSRIIPIFPLPNTVLFPGATLPLHVFEPRYRELIEDVLADNKQFGLSWYELLSEEESDSELTKVLRISEVGTIAEVVEHEPLPDGRSNIITVGKERYSIQKLITDEKSYYQAEIVPYEDETADCLPEDLDKLLGLFNELVRLSRALDNDHDPIEVRLPEAITDKTFAIARYFFWDQAFQQALLEKRSPKSRLELEMEALEPAVHKLAALVQIEGAFRLGEDAEGEKAPEKTTEDPMDDEPSND